MPITWKKRFKPDVVLRKIAKTRSVSSDGRVSFSGFEAQEYLQIIATMLNFPSVAERLNQGALIWAALAEAKGDLDRNTFEVAINNALQKNLATTLKKFQLVTSISAQPSTFPNSIQVMDATIQFLPKGLPKRFNHRHDVIKSNRIDIPDTPSGYLAVRIAVRDKSPTSAAQQAIDRLDLLRGVVALYANYAMQWALGGNVSYEPINRVRCGSRHTIHTPDGKIASEAVWFEHNFRPAKIYETKNPAELISVVRRDFRLIAASPYSSELANSLVKYARALDEPDPNTAFIKLWSALESLTTPGVAQYDNVVKRCSFLYQDVEYHQQVLEHLREYRNRSVHSGIEGEDGRTNCYLLQQYFRGVFHFYKRNSQGFSSLSEANAFLDLPAERHLLVTRIDTLRKALKFMGQPNDESEP